MQTLIINLGGLAGLLVFLSQMGNRAPLGRTLLTAFGAGVAVYLALLVGYVSIQYIVGDTPSTADEAGGRSAKEASASSKTQAEQAETQVA